MCFVQKINCTSNHTPTARPPYPHLDYDSILSNSFLENRCFKFFQCFYTVHMFKKTKFRLFLATYKFFSNNKSSAEDRFPKIFLSYIFYLVALEEQADVSNTFLVCVPFLGTCYMIKYTPIHGF